MRIFLPLPSSGEGRGEGKPPEATCALAFHLGSATRELRFLIDRERSGALRQAGGAVGDVGPPRREVSRAALLFRPTIPSLAPKAGEVPRPPPPLTPASEHRFAPG